MMTVFLLPNKREITRRLTHTQTHAHAHIHTYTHTYTLVERLTTVLWTPPSRLLCGSNLHLLRRCWVDAVREELHVAVVVVDLANERWAVALELLDGAATEEAHCTLQLVLENVDRLGDARFTS